MPPDLLFSICNTVALLGWLFLLFLPRWTGTTSFVAPIVIPVLLGLVYVTLIVTNFGTSDGGFGSLEGVKQLFENDYLVVAGWIHYLAFDLFVGNWILRNAQKLDIRHLIVIPCLLGTFMFGPAGLLLYLAVRGGLRKKVLIAD